LQQHNGFGVDDFSFLYGAHRLFKTEFNRFHIFAFFLDAASCAGMLIVMIFRDKKVQFLRY